VISGVGAALNRFARRYVPEPFVLAFLLTAVVFVCGAVLLLTTTDLTWESAGWQLASGWMADFSNPKLLGFALQMCFVLVTGHALAMSRPIQRAVSVLATIPQGAASATAMVAVVACLAALLHWGLGAIVGAFLAREIGRHARSRKLEIHYPLLGAAAYAGMAVWHGGFSGSAPTLVAKGGELSLWDMLLSPLNLAVVGSLVVAIPLVLALLCPKKSEEMSPPPASLEPVAPAEESESDGLAANPLVGILIGVFGLVIVFALIATSRAKFEINTINAIFFFSGLALVGRLGTYAALARDGARGAGAIIIQFPLYFGVLGMMKASGLVAWISDGMASAASKATLPLVDFVSAGAVNMAIPSGGGQWIVQRDILLAAGAELGVAPVTTIMAFAYGDAWTNMLQPFWALPLLAIMGLKAKDIIGYTAMVFLVMGLIVPFWLLVLG